MSKGSEKPLSMEDRILWNKVARTTRPLAGKTIEEVAAEPEAFGEMLDVARGRDAAVTAQKQPAKPRSEHGRQHRIDAPTREKLAKGRVAIEGKVDLHGLTQSEAHVLLLSFLHRAYADGRRHVLVVTGKGSSLGSDGVLKRAVPAWFATQPFRALVAGYEDAARRHGGTGAIYVRLRRPGAPA